nr:immunoglobulin heavy chain junction region [Macaca mulatta]
CVRGLVVSALRAAGPGLDYW